jgi:hypothetical protein
MFLNPASSDLFWTQILEGPISPLKQGFLYDYKLQPPRSFRNANTTFYSSKVGQPGLLDNSLLICYFINYIYSFTFHAFCVFVFIVIYCFIITSVTDLLLIFSIITLLLIDYLAYLIKLVLFNL